MNDNDIHYRPTSIYALVICPIVFMMFASPEVILLAASRACTCEKCAGLGLKGATKYNTHSPLSTHGPPPGFTETSGVWCYDHRGANTRRRHEHLGYLHIGFGLGSEELGTKCVCVRQRAPARLAVVGRNLEVVPCRHLRFLAGISPI